MFYSPANIFCRSKTTASMAVAVILFAPVSGLFAGGLGFHRSHFDTAD
jgi:hypothetical protein